MNLHDWDDARYRPRRAAIGPRHRGSRFGLTWWGKAWVEALEQRASLDRNRLPRGRTYARGGAVGALELGPGEVTASVQGSRPRPYTVRLRVREFTSAEWDLALRAIAARASHAAALVDGTLDPGIIPDLEAEGVSLLPLAGEMGPACNCPDWANPCKHAAAVCYLVADRMDSDPFTIFLLRGRSRDQVLAGVRACRSQSERGLVAGSAAELGDAGIEARILYQTPRRPRTLPAPLPLPQRPGHPPGLLIAEGERVTGEALSWLAQDAADRAFALGQGRGGTGLSLPEYDDLARIAAGRIGKGNFDALARRSGMAARALMRLALAWRAGGAAAVEVLEQHQWRPPLEVVSVGTRAMGQLPGPNSQRGDRITNPKLGIQLRYGSDGLWYLLLRRGGVWEIHDPPGAEPEALLRPQVEALRETYPLPPDQVSSAAVQNADEEPVDDWELEGW